MKTPELQTTKVAKTKAVLNQIGIIVYPVMVKSFPALRHGENYSISKNDHEQVGRYKAKLDPGNEDSTEKAQILANYLQFIHNTSPQIETVTIKFRPKLKPEGDC
ncbi:hypothetical protein QE152_g1767 [Popillia japonica]|uniref:Uncharacterized protein n=1 Tax=Popillia japonica TaxID=7064 RepID=A0AAW1N5R8_POPJA